MNKQIRVASSLLTILLLASPVYAADVSDGDIRALKEQIAKLSQKVDRLEAQARKTKTAQKAPVSSADATAPAATPGATAVPAAKVSAADVVTKGTFPGSFHIPGTDTSVKLGGYVKLDVIENIGTGYDQSYARFLMLPLSNSAAADRSSQTTFTAQQSRVNFETRTPSSLGEIKTFVEGDFYGSAGTNNNTSGYGFMLRHAYGSVGSAATGQVLAGQTWSDFMDVTAMPESLDYIGPAGTIFVRQPQVRYTQAVGPVTLSASVEVPADVVQTTQNAVLQANPTTAGTTYSARPQMPDIVARGDYNYADKGYVSVRAVVNQTNVDHQTTSTTVANESTAVKYGYGLAMSGKQGVFSKDAVLYDFVLGNGTGRYDYDVGAAGVYYNSATGTLKTQPYYGGTLGYQHVWSDTFRSNLFGGVARIVNDTNIMNATAKGFANKFVASGHANLIWQPSPAYKVGIEYMYGYRRVESGLAGNLNRAEASFMYNF